MAVSTINKTGEDYGTLTLWEDAKDGNLVGETRQETADCYDDDGSLNDYNITIDGSTTNATYYMKVSSPAGERHSGTIASGFTIDPQTYNGTIITASDPYTVIEWIIIKNWGAGAWSSANAIGTGGYTTDADYITIRNCIIADCNGSGSSDHAGINTGDRSGAHIYIYNNIIYNISDASGAFKALGITGGGSRYIYNNTVYDIVGGEAGSVGINGAAECYNNIAHSCTTDFGGTISASSNNFSKDDTAPGASSIHGDTDGKTPDFVNTASDFHLQSTSDAIDVGTDLSAKGFSDDIDGVTRSGTWDIGADEYYSGEPPAVEEANTAIYYTTWCP